MNVQKLQGATRSKTNWLMLATMLLGFWQVSLPGVIPPEWSGFANVFIGSLGLVIRWYTDTGLEDKAPPPDDGSDSGV